MCSCWRYSDATDSYSYSYSDRVTLFNELFSEESCSVIGLSEKMGFQLTRIVVLVARTITPIMFSDAVYKIARSVNFG